MIRLTIQTDDHRSTASSISFRLDARRRDQAGGAVLLPSGSRIRARECPGKVVPTFPVRSMARTLGRDEIEGLGAGAIAHRRRPRHHRRPQHPRPRQNPRRIAIDPTAGTGSFIPPALAGWSGIARRNDDRLSGSWGRYRKRSQESRGHYRTTHHHPVPFFVDFTVECTPSGGQVADRRIG